MKHKKGDPWVAFLVDSIKLIISSSYLFSVSKSTSEGSAGAASGSVALVLLCALTIINITKPTINKLIMVFTYLPHIIAFFTLPSSL